MKQVLFLLNSDCKTELLNAYDYQKLKHIMLCKYWDSIKYTIIYTNFTEEELPQWVRTNLDHIDIYFS